MSIVKIKLVSDFRDYYDNYFDVVDYDIIFNRKTKTNISRVEIFRLLEDVGFNVPFNGYLTPRILDILYDFHFDRHIVIYHDLYFHPSKFKEVIRVKDLNVKYMYKYFSLYIYDEKIKRKEFQKTQSNRILIINDVVINLVYRSNDKWFSNKGNVEIELLDKHTNVNDVIFGRLLQIQKLLNHPLIAIDGKYDKNDKNFYVFDLNTAPQLIGTGIENLIEPDEIVYKIKEFYDGLC